MRNLIIKSIKMVQKLTPYFYGNFPKYKRYHSQNLTVSRSPKVPTSKRPYLQPPQPLQNSKTIVEHPSQALRLLQTSLFETSQALVKSPASWGKPPKTLGGLLQVCL